MKSAAQSFRPLAAYTLASCGVLLSSCLTAQARTFDAVGSDLLMGVGGRDIALGGAVVASTGDAYSSYWNPAGLAELRESQLAFSRQIDGTLDPLSFVGIAISRPQLKVGRHKVVFAYAWIPRLHVKAAGNFSADEFESTFTQYALPGLPADFDGNIESKTREHKFSMAISPVNASSWSIGASLGRVDCGTSFCGTFAEDPGNYTIASAGATAISFGLGAKYHLNERLSLAFNISDPATHLRSKQTQPTQMALSVRCLIPRSPRTSRPDFFGVIVMAWIFPLTSKESGAITETRRLIFVYCGAESKQRPARFTIALA